MAGIYNFPIQLEDDSLKSWLFTLTYNENGVPRTLLNCNVIFEVYRGKSSKVYLRKESNNTEIDILDPNTGDIRIPAIHDHGLKDDDYYYALRVEWLDGLDHTFIGGLMPIRKVIDGLKYDTI